MKAQANSKPAVIGRFGSDFIYRFDAMKETIVNDEGTVEAYTYESIKVSKPSQSLLTEAIIRSRYTVSDEFRMNRVRDAEFDEYDAFVDDAKFVAKVLLKIISLPDMTVSQLDRTAKVYGIEDYPLSALKAEKLAYLTEVIK